MPTSTFLARLIGPVLLCVGLGAILNGQIFNVMAAQFLSNLGLIYLSGIVTLLAGILIVTYHNAWDWHWRTIITVIGWLALIGGVLRIVIPDKVAAVGLATVSNVAVLPISGLFVFAIAVILTYFGYQSEIRAWKAKSAPARRRKRR
jgi:hypothetical protein